MNKILQHSVNYLRTNLKYRDIDELLDSVLEPEEKIEWIKRNAKVMYLKLQEIEEAEWETHG